MVVAKSERAYSVLKAAFKERTVDKVYHAVVQGHPDPSRGTVDAPIGRHPKDDWRWAVTAGGKESVTHYETLEAFRAASLLVIHLETGRTHQIRVHMSALRHPCVGDLTYGADPTLSARLGLTRQWLHARELGFAHPSIGRAGAVHLAVPGRPRARARGAARGVESTTVSSTSAPEDLPPLARAAISVERVGVRPRLGDEASAAQGSSTRARRLDRFTTLHPGECLTRW